MPSAYPLLSRLGPAQPWAAAGTPNRPARRTAQATTHQAGPGGAPARRAGHGGMADRATGKRAGAGAAVAAAARARKETAMTNVQQPEMRRNENNPTVQDSKGPRPGDA